MSIEQALHWQGALKLVITRSLSLECSQNSNTLLKATTTAPMIDHDDMRWDAMPEELSALEYVTAVETLEVSLPRGMVAFDVRSFEALIPICSGIVIGTLPGTGA